MKVVVCIKQVPETGAVGIDPERLTLKRAGVPAILNPLDAWAIELAVRLAGDDGATALSMGPPAAEAVLREAVARGCDRAVLASDAAFAGSDTWATAVVLAAAVRALFPVDLVVCGCMASDGDTAQVPPELAALLGWPQATEVGAATVVGGGLRVRRQVDDAEEELELPLPAVLTVLKRACVPRLPNLPRALRARRCVVERFDRERLGLDPEACGLSGSPTRVEKIFPPPTRAAGLRHADAAALDAALRAEGLRR
jgi:electron transfer flavoprotein beta subunit